MLRTGIGTIICLSPNFLYVYVYVYVMKSTGSVVTYLTCEFLIPACFTYTFGLVHFRNVIRIQF